MQIQPISASQTVPLRHSVLWPDQPVSYVLLPEDDAGRHFGAFLSRDSSLSPEPRLVAVISLFPEALPTDHNRLGLGLEAAGSESPAAAARFRKFACDPAYQGRGIGTALLRHAFEYAKSAWGCSVVWCDARVATAGWYERRGMQRFGEHFYKGSVEYVKVKIDL